MNSIINPPLMLSAMEPLNVLVQDPTPENIQTSNKILEKYSHLLGVEAIFIMDAGGLTIAASNWRDKISFIGKDYRFRPYFQQAISGSIGMYVAQGVTSGILGMYIGIPIGDKNGTPVGVLVCKYPSDILLPVQAEGNNLYTYLLADELGIIFSSSDPKFKMTTLRKLDHKTVTDIAHTKRYDTDLLRPPVLFFTNVNTFVGEAYFSLKTRFHAALEKIFFIHEHMGNFMPLPNSPGWQLGVMRENYILKQNVLVHLIPNVLLVLLIYIFIILFYSYSSERRMFNNTIQLLMRYAPVSIAMFDHKLRYLHASDRWFNDHNLDRKQATGRRYFDLVTNADPRWMEIFDHCLSGQRQRREADRFGDPNGKPMWVTWEAIPWENKGKEDVGVLIVQEDVSVRVNMENQVRLQRDQLAEERDLIEDIIVKMRSAKEFYPNHLNYITSPVEKTSGDILLSALRPDGGHYVVLGDFTGHGLPSALASPLIAHLFYEMTANGLPLSQILIEINEELHHKMPVGIFMCAVFLEINPDRNVIKLWNSAMPDVLLFRNNSLFMNCKSSLAPLGIQGLSDVSCQEILVERGDRIVALSDGIIESQNNTGEIFGQEKTEKTIEYILQNGWDISRILSIIDHFCGNRDTQHDDITIVEMIV
ncbi:MAG: response regulator receiver protein [Magnetococcales bacterium]|nr:response regulator receiver protein [Magnetococcales bacterium]